MKKDTLMRIRLIKQTAFADKRKTGMRPTEASLARI
jgi:hypothetical protein